MLLAVRTVGKQERPGSPRALLLQQGRCGFAAGVAKARMPAALAAASVAVAGWGLRMEARWTSEAAAARGEAA